jgi:hypothetical protein
MTAKPFLTLDRRTILSADHLYRYTLWREFGLSAERFVMFVALNPSTADHAVDDPSSRRCIDFAKRWGFDAMVMVNLFAFRATDPLQLRNASDPVGPDNDAWLDFLAPRASLIVAAWGVHGSLMGRDAAVARRMPSMVCLGTTKDGAPRHPLYMRATTPLQPYFHPAGSVHHA